MKPSPNATPPPNSAPVGPDAGEERAGDPDFQSDGHRVGDPYATQKPDAATAGEVGEGSTLGSSADLYPTAPPTDDSTGGSSNSSDRRGRDLPSTAIEVQQVGNYCLVDKIGSGAMGDVYLARHIHFTQRRFAVKLIRPQYSSPTSRDRFQREIKAMGGLEHPNLVFAGDAGVDNDTWYLVMEYIPGRDLQHILDSEGPFSVGHAAELTRQICEGIEHAHRRRIIHRDIKPSNIILADSGIVKILDLGIASLQGDDTRFTHHEEVLGTAAFLAPELWRRAADAGPASDVYAIACTAYSLLSGRPPFNWGARKSFAELMVSHQEETPVPLHERVRGIPEPLCEIIAQALEKRPADRIQTAGEFARRLAPFCEPLPACRRDTRRIDEESSACRGGEDQRREADGDPAGTILSHGSDRSDSEQNDAEVQTPSMWTRNREQPKPIFKRIYWTAGALIFLSSLALILTYYGPFSAPAWRVRFDRLGNPVNPIGGGFLIELIRGWLYITLTVVILGTLFTREIRTFFDYRKRKMSVMLLRLAICAVIGVFVMMESRRQLSLDKAPAALAQWGAEHGIETTAEAEAGPYRPYLLYSLINYVVVMGGLFAFPFIRFLFSDLHYILNQLKKFHERQLREDASGRLTDRLFHFGTELRTLTGRYIAVLGAMAVGTHYDYWIGSLTLTEEGQQTMVLGAFVAYLALAFVLIIAYVYYRGFQVTGERLATHGTIASERDLSSLSTLWFLKTTLVYNLGGLACLSLAVLFLHALMR